MNLAQLHDLIQDGHTTATLFEGATQRLIAVPEAHHDSTLTECANCCLLLSALPRPLTVQRAYVVSDRAIPRTISFTHAHVARPDGGAACSGCLTDFHACPDHTPAHMCDTPEPIPCHKCGNPVRVSANTCTLHRHHDIN